MVEGEVMAAMPGGDWPALSDVEEKTLGDRYAEEIARDFDPASQVRAMDKEGLDSRSSSRPPRCTSRLRENGRALRGGGVPRLQRLLHDYIEAADPSACSAPPPSRRTT